MKWFSWVAEAISAVGTVIGWVRRARSWADRNHKMLRDAYAWVEYVSHGKGWDGPHKLRVFLIDLESRLGRGLTDSELAEAQRWAERTAKQMKE